jgi:alpha-beta hydrolase superfamily lysophospholipase
MLDISTSTLSPPIPKPRRWRRRVGVLVAMSLVGWLVSSLVVAWLLTHRPCARFAEPAPKLAGTSISDVRLTTCDGQDIGAWFVRAQPGRAIFLLLHGNGDSRTWHTSLLAQLASEGYGVMAISLRAHGDSSGSLNDVGWGARHDVVAAVEYVHKQCPGTPVVICGVSLGAAAAAYAADELGDRVSAYVFDSLYLDLDSAVRNRLHLFLPPVARQVAYLGLRLWAPAFLTQPMRAYSPLEHLPAIPQSCPVVFLCGCTDDRVPPAESQRLHDSIRAHARLIKFEGVGHAMLCRQDPQRYLQILREVASGCTTDPNSP